MERRKWKGMKRLMYLEAEVGKEADDEATHIVPDLPILGKIYQ